MSADPDLLARITEWVGDGALALADLGYEGEPDIFRRLKLGTATKHRPSSVADFWHPTRRRSQLVEDCRDTGTASVIGTAEPQ